MEEKGLLSILNGFFCSLKLTLFLLILLAILSIVGSFITQNASPAEYIQRYGPGLYEVLDFFSLFDMYHSWWFRIVLMLLAINVIACSTQRFPGVWRQVFRERATQGLQDSMLKTLPYVERVKGAELISEEAIRRILKKRFAHPLRIETDSHISLYGDKGRFSRFGAYFTHLSLLIILIGGLVGSTYGFRGFVQIPEGEVIDQIYLRVKGADVPRPLGFSIRCDDFSVTYYDLPGKQRYVKEYSSQVTVMENGKEVMRKTIQVNHPLHYRGLAFYQASYGTINEITMGVEWGDKKGRTILRGLEGDTLPIPNTNAMVRILRYVPELHNFGEGVQVAVFRPDESPRSYWLLRQRNFPPFDEKGRDGFSLHLEGVHSREYTGLQVTKDPGVWVVWVGSGLMILGLVVSFFFSHQRLWVRIPKEDGRSREVVIGGSTSKNRIGFEKRFREIVEQIRSGR